MVVVDSTVSDPSHRLLRLGWRGRLWNQRFDGARNWHDGVSVDGAERQRNPTSESVIYVCFDMIFERG
jgi:hypothetical protein